jgi:hypothetical protein
MKRLFSLPGACLVGLVLLAVLPGCKKKDDVALIPVEGKVSIKGGGTVSAGHVTFWSTAGKESKAGNPTGEIKDGTYKITTDGRAGAPEGTYKVTLSSSMVPTGGNAPPTMNYDNSYTRMDTTTLTIKVPSQNYDLNLDPKK